MSVVRQPHQEPLWRDEFSVHAEDERYVTRRQFVKFLLLTSVAMFVGNLWILLRSWLFKRPVFPAFAVAEIGEIPVGGVKTFSYPTANDPCILVRTSDDTYVAFSQKCTHLSCAVFYSAKTDRLECPCHNGAFSVTDGRVIQGPPPRPLPRVTLERRGTTLIATAVLEGG
jgi:Rieske Fe-S protein